MQDGGAHLALDVVADDGQAGILEAFAPVFGAGDEDRDAVDHANAGFKDLLYIPFGGHF
ncbi:hypothetical protein SDC9_179276 [bioreactor metagenome]|uniref:Uncharacterized protein n=1 Tax=bioreactor metagenome TaxID=1076179 RepID=A0A645GY72_9ZZZZ